MKKIILISLLALLSAVAMAQFRVGIQAGGGAGLVDKYTGTRETILPPDSSNVAFVGSIGVLAELRTGPIFFRSGAVFQSNDQLYVPIQMFLISNSGGAFIGGGYSLAMMEPKIGEPKMDMINIILGNKLSRTMDFALQFDYPAKSNVLDATLSIKIGYYPLSTCRARCQR